MVKLFRFVLTDVKITHGGLGEFLKVNVHVFHVIRCQSLQEFGIPRLTVEPSLHHIVESVPVFFVGDGDFENETAVGGLFRYFQVTAGKQQRPECIGGGIKISESNFFREFHFN